MVLARHRGHPLCRQRVVRGRLFARRQELLGGGSRGFDLPGGGARGDFGLVEAHPGQRGFRVSGLVRGGRLPLAFQLLPCCCQRRRRGVTQGAGLRHRRFAQEVPFGRQAPTGLHGGRVGEAPARFLDLGLDAVAPFAGPANRLVDGADADHAEDEAPALGGTHAAQAVEFALLGDDGLEEAVAVEAERPFDVRRGLLA